VTKPVLVEPNLALEQNEHVIARRTLAQDLVASVEIDHFGDRKDAQDFLVGEVTEQRHLAQDLDLAIQLLGARLPRIRGVG